jgi:hypothetical protein
MRKVSVDVFMNYMFTIDVPDELIEDDVALMEHCDCEDPVFSDLCKILHNQHLNFEATITSIVDDATGEILYTE